MVKSLPPLNNIWKTLGMVKNINFYYKANLEKTNDQIVHYLGELLFFFFFFFFKKCNSIMHNFIWDSNTILKFRKSNKNPILRKGLTDRQKDVRKDRPTLLYRNLLEDFK